MHGQASEVYHDNWKDQPGNEEAVHGRRQQAQAMTNAFYDLVTDFYEYGWGQSFHFAKLYKGDTFEENIKRHEAFLASRLGLRRDHRVLDVGCGVGGPLREVVKASGGAHVTGINNNAYQVERCFAYAEKYGLASRCDFVKGDFTKMPVQDGYFDAVFSVEATVHAPQLEMVYGEIYRVLKPGGLFACYEWVTTDDYDTADLVQAKVIHEIEKGNSISKLYTAKQCVAALQAVGFRVREHYDMATTDPEATEPWYHTLSRLDPNLRGVLRSPWGRRYTDTLLTVLDRLHLVPSGVLETSRLLNAAADNLVKGGELGIFTPMYYFTVEKPL
ncbi:S-adenosyl-L-methionine-dependent methyltransferase [Hesseltinella vesiculosa]|uniref:Sterol 24-C-methyltransferase n=1 Tax=Hesseltinella vesiculosa TaxID=101127 RepID=A0A1X2GZS7_9FUNG|nr:S-adenosyl-L-methionine-dependent methyltransferase [Hesseltinella vesiculosa]